MRCLAVLLTLALIACNSPAPPSTAPREVHPWTAINRTVRLKSGAAVCGAVAIGPEVLATAAHCTPSDSVTYATRDEPDNWRAGVVMLRDEPADLAVVNTSAPLRDWATLATARPGDSVYSIHHGGGDLWSLHFGHVEGEPRINAADWVETSVDISPGASGAGLWDGDDRLAGITSWFRGSSSYFVPSREIVFLSR